MISLSEREAVALYKYLKSQEISLEDDLLAVLSRIEKKLYERLSIEEMEQLARCRPGDGAAQG